MKCSIIALEKKLFDGEVSFFHAPGEDGFFGVMNHHTPMVSALRNGEIRLVLLSGEQKTYPIKSGIVEVKDNIVTALVRLPS